MDFIKYINTPKNTPANDPLETTLKLTKGRLMGGFLYFPSGPAGKLYFLARIGMHQIIPFNSGEAYRLDDCVIPLHFDIQIQAPPYKIICETWNTSTDYDHVLTVGFFLQPKSKRNRNINTMTQVAELREGYQKS